MGGGERESQSLRVCNTGNYTWRDEHSIEYETLPALPNTGIRASSPKAGWNRLSPDTSIIVLEQDKIGKMEETIRAMQKKMNDLQQQQGDNTMGAGT